MTSKTDIQNDINIEKNSLGYYRLGTFGVEEILELLDDYHNKGGKKVNQLYVRYFNKRGEEVIKTTIDYKGQQFKIGSLRLQTFLYKGVKCGCGVEGKFFSLDTTNLDFQPHINLIGVHPNGDEVLMTSDHIYPKSKGGSEGIENRQTMCSKCNCKKADKVK